jgi:hypothetical protein
MEMYDKIKIGLNEALIQSGPNKGMLKKKIPPMNTYGLAVWSAIQSYSNPYKLNFSQLYFMDKDVFEVYTIVRKIGRHVDLSTFDSDANALRSIGIF